MTYLCTMRIRNVKGSRKSTCKCGDIVRPGQRTCKLCHAKYMRENRKKQTEPLSPSPGILNYKFKNEVNPEAE